MQIKLKCSHCGYEKILFSQSDLVPEEKSCSICKEGQMQITNLKELVKQDILEQADVKLKESFKGLGLEGTIEVVSKYTHLITAYKDKINELFRHEMFEFIKIKEDKQIEELTLELSK